jgi:hypothetical protein
MRKLIIFPFILACAPLPVRPDDMSASEHRTAAAKEREKARDAMENYNPQAPDAAYWLPSDMARSDDPGVLFVAPIFNPTIGAVYDADRHLEHAYQHERAAATLEHFEDVACADYPPPERAACPLLSGVDQMVDVPGGVRIRFDHSVDVASIVSHMRCHLAYARTRGYEVVADCPLYVRGVHVERVGETRVIDILADSRLAVRNVRLRAREEAVPAIR